MAARIDCELGKEWGVSAGVIQAAAAAHLQEPDVFYTEEIRGQKKKHYTAGGIEHLKQIVLGSPGEKKAAGRLEGLGDVDAGGEKEPPAKTLLDPAVDAEKERSEAVGLIVRRIYPNPIWVVVETPEKKPADVRVRHSKLLCVGHRLRCVHNTAEGRWECADPQLCVNPVYRTR